jgi:hypothetical protein
MNNGGSMFGSNNNQMGGNIFTNTNNMTGNTNYNMFPNTNNNNGGMNGLGLGFSGQMNGKSNGDNVAFDLHRIKFAELEKLAQYRGLVQRMSATYRMVNDSKLTLDNLDDSRLKLQLKHLQEVKESIHRAKLDIEDVENIKLKQNHLLNGPKNGLEHVKQVLIRDQRYASQAARDLKENRSQHVAPTNFFDRLYTNLCEQMTGTVQ